MNLWHILAKNAMAKALPSSLKNWYKDQEQIAVAYQNLIPIRLTAQAETLGRREGIFAALLLYGYSPAPGKFRRSISGSITS